MRNTNFPTSFRLPVAGLASRLAIALVLLFAGVAFADEALAEDTPSVIAAPDDVAAPPEDAEEVSGVFVKVLEPGTGEKNPLARSKVKVHYTGWTTDGKMFDSSVTRGQPATFGLHQVIRGWTVGLRTMVEGEKKRLWIPEDLAYGGRPGAPQGMLVFDVELIEIVQR